jgi:hypothetical protein
VGIAGTNWKRERAAGSTCGFHARISGGGYFLPVDLEAAFVDTKRGSPGDEYQRQQTTFWKKRVRALDVSEIAHRIICENGTWQR